MLGGVSRRKPYRGLVREAQESAGTLDGTRYDQNLALPLLAWQFDPKSLLLCPSILDGTIGTSVLADVTSGILGNSGRLRLCWHRIRCMAATRWHTY